VFIDLTGRIFGKLTVIKQENSDTKGNSRWLCKCSCSNEKIILGYNLINNTTKSCGCLKKEKLISRNIKHGYKGKSTYNIWQTMIQRCNNPNSRNYPRYGGRGIKICKRWLLKNTGFKNFLEDVGEIPSGKSLDRIDNNKGYSPENCKLSTRNEQMRNTRQNINITYKDKTQCLKDWAKELNINYNTLYSRIYQSNWSIEKSLTTPVKHVNN
jgi:hypothetical protein